MKSLKLFAAAATMLWGVQALAADYTIVVNSSYAGQSISSQELKNVYLGNTTSLGGVKAEPCIWADPEGKAFFESMLGVPEKDFTQAWVKKELSGAGTAPTAKDTVDSVIDYAANNRGAICFIPSSASSKVDGANAKTISVQ